MEFKTLEELQAYNKSVFENSSLAQSRTQNEQSLDIDGLNYFERITYNCQPHKVFKLDWSSYSPNDFADTFLPKAEGYEVKGVRFYDGADLLNGLQSSPRKLLPLTDSNQLISIITCTYPKGVEADKKKNRVQPSNHEIAVFIEIDEQKNIETSFKFGRDTQSFLREYFKKNDGLLEFTDLENKIFKTSITGFQKHFNNKLSHNNMMNFVLKTVGVNTASAYGNTDKGNLEHLLRENKIDGFIYKNTCSNKTIVIQGTIIKGWLELKYIDNSQIDSITNLKISEEKNCIIFKRKDLWNKSDLAIANEYNNGNCPNIETAITEEEIKHISNLLTEHIQFTKLKGSEKQFAALNKEIEKQINNPFYADVNLCVNLKINDKSEQKQQASRPLDGQNNSIPISNNIKTFKSTWQKNDKPCEISLDITIDSNGKLKIKHIASKDYLKEFEGKWEQEIKKRGLDINITELRQQVLNDFTSAEIEHNFFETFVQKTKALLSEQVGGYIEAIHSTQKIAKNVWKEGQVNESTWYSKDDAHKEWPKYVQFAPVIGGATDGVIDEVVGIPMAIKGVYGIATDKKQREAIGKIFTKEGFKGLLEGLLDNAKETLQEEDKREHFGGKTTITVASMMVPGMQITKIGKIDEVISSATDGLKKLSNPKVLEGVDVLKLETKYLPNDSPEIPKFLKNREEVKDFLQKTDADILDDLAEDLPKILKKGEDASVLAKARNLPGSSTGFGKEITGKWLKGTGGNAGLFPKSIAEKLKGQDFSSFDAFRQKFWKEVAEDSDLAPQFSVQNIAKMKNGNAPTPIPEQWLGGQTSYILHHKTPINQGGKVYDMDNLYIVTPRFHKEILAPEFHYGYGY